MSDARKVGGILENRFSVFRRKNRGSVSAADTQPLIYVSSHFLLGERLCSTPHGNALAQLAEPRITQLFFKLRLTGKNNLKQLFACCFEIGEQTNLLENFVGEVLRFIHDQDRRLAITKTLQQPVVETHQHVTFVTALARNAEVCHHEVKELARIELRVKNIGSGNAFEVQPVEQPIEQRRLACAHFTRQQDESFTVLDAVGESPKPFLDFPPHEQLTKVRVALY